MKPQISIIVPAYHAETTLGQCLDALQHQSLPRECYEVIVVDDASDDRTPEIAAGYPGVRLVDQNHAGPAAARNRGAEIAEGEILLYTDADCIPAFDWVERMAEPFQAGEVAGVKGVYTSEQKELVARFVQFEYEDKYARMRTFPAIDFIDTYSAGYRRKVFNDYGGFDESYPTASVEDQEFSFRLAAGGHRMVFVPEARVRHLGHASSLLQYAGKKFKIGYWKVKLHLRHPDKLLRDTHTPQILKIQIILAALTLAGAAAGLAWRPALWPALAGAAAFLLSALPFIWRFWREDPLVALVSPLLLFVRALALGFGLLAGLLDRAGGRATKE